MARRGRAAEVAERTGVDRKTARRYVAAAQAAGLTPDAGVEALCDELIGAVVAAVRPVRPNGHGSAWDPLHSREEQVTAWVGGGDGQPPLSVVKIAGCEAAWEFFGGRFKVLIPDNLKAVVTKAEAVNPQLSTASPPAARESANG